jgi:hypothetical protein
MAAMAHFGSQIADASKTTSDKRGFKQHILKENYHAVDKNCTTMCISGVQAGKSDLGGKLSDPKESKGRGLNWLEKQMAGEVGEKIFMPADLKANIEAGGGYYKHNEYKSGQEVQQ